MNPKSKRGSKQEHFIFMFPFVAVAGETLDIAVGLWDLVRLVLGLAIRAQASEPIIAAGEVAR